MQSWIDSLRSHHMTVLVVVAFALFMDYFLYGMVVPLTPYSPAGVKDESHLGLLYLSYSVGVLLFTPVCGIFADRVGRRWPMIWGVVAQAAATALFCFAGSFPVLCAGRVLQGVASAATWTAGLALIAEHFPLNRVQMMGFALMGSTAGSVLGPTLGGVLYDRGGYALPFATVGVLIAVDVCARTLLLPRDAGAPETNSQLMTVIKDRSVLAAGLAVALAASSWAVVEPLLPNHLERTAGATAGTVGIMFTVAAVVYGCMAPVVSRVSDRLGVRRTVCMGMLMMAAVLPLLAIVHGVLWAGVALCLVSIAYAFILNPTSAELGNAVDRQGLDCYAAAYAVYNIAYSLGMMGTDAFTAVVADSVPFQQALLMVSAQVLVGIPLFLLGGPRSAEPLSGSVLVEGGCMPAVGDEPGEDSSCNQ